MHVTSQRNYATITLSSDWKKTQGEKQNNFVISSFILVKRAAKWQLLTLLFRKSEDENKSQICDFSRFFSRKGEKGSVANATVLVAISTLTGDGFESCWNCLNFSGACKRCLICPLKCADNFSQFIIKILFVVKWQIFERILYIWAIRHPASGYVQGINDLVTPFFVVFLSAYVGKNQWATWVH